MTKNKKKNNNNKNNITRIKPPQAIVWGMAIAQVITLTVIGIIYGFNAAALNNYRELQERQIQNVINECNSKISSGLSAEEEKVRAVIRVFASRATTNANFSENLYQNDLSLSYCRAAEFTLHGIQNIFGRKLIDKGDNLFGLDEPRKVTFESFDDIRW